MQGNSKAAAAKKKSAAAGEPSDAPRRDHRWDGEHELVESDVVSHFVGAWVSGVLDAGDEHEDDEPAPKMQNVYRSFQDTLWLLLLLWLVVVANDSAVVCYRAGVGCLGCAGCSKMFCSLCLPRSAGPCEKSSCSQFGDCGCNRFRLAAV